jgi:hypothetical protein
MAERKYYARCEQGCLFETMTKEQILAAIAQAVETGSITDIDAGFITTIKELNRGTGLKFWFGTTAEYNAITEKDANCYYIKTDDTTAADTDAAIKELKEMIESIGSAGVGDATKEYVDEQDAALKTYIDTQDNNIKALLPTKIAFGRYMGTGDFGAGNESQLTFEFSPKVVILFENGGLKPSYFIKPEEDDWGNVSSQFFINLDVNYGALCNAYIEGKKFKWSYEGQFWREKSNVFVNVGGDYGEDDGYGIGYGKNIYTEGDGNTVELEARGQLNVEGIPYYYLAFGI